MVGRFLLTGQHKKLLVHKISISERPQKASMERIYLKFRYPKSRYRLGSYPQVASDYAQDDLSTRAHGPSAPFEDLPKSGRTHASGMLKGAGSPSVVHE
ncbi:hypothetical protein D3C80_1915040 [compost metagenome]